ncbi:hypothetical protein BLNAU_4895 [Blattamonas nauphoetae]|uniref:DNA helicase n=1 Tax=Blattamonas nauphoetae TaxID=2049346 RepID=A0ABQ9Y8C0_9EUKA|nr:hypothetical protein BLNAU_4895 [Blattamonas nauphoetae]
MSRETIRDISYRLVADPNLLPPTKSKKRKTTSLSVLQTVTIPDSFTIDQLYSQLALDLKDSHVYITIQFPCTIPPDHVEDDLPGRDILDPSRVPHLTQWIGLVGWSGYRYDPSETIRSLLNHWPRQGRQMVPMQVVAIPTTGVEQLLPLADETEEELTDRVHLMGSMYDLFYTQAVERGIALPTVDSKFRDRIQIYIRDCWNEFRIGVIAHFERFCQRAALTHAELKSLRRDCFTNGYLPPKPGEDEELWRSLHKTPDWIAFEEADVSPFPTLVDVNLMGRDFYKAIYVNGQPGTGKSQMLIYLIHCLIKRYQKVAVIYALPDLPVITILVDTSNHSDPIRIRSHFSSLPEDWYTKGFSVVRVVDSVDPKAAIGMQDYFTVYAASPTKYTVHIRSLDKWKTKWFGKYPFWTEKEFYMLLKCLGMTNPEHWIRPVTASTIVKLHPLVIQLLGAHGSLMPESRYSQFQTAASARRANADSILPGGLPLNLVSEVTTPPEGMNPAQSPTEQGGKPGRSLPPNDFFVCLNMIEVFGLSPRALSFDLNGAFDRISEMFGNDGITIDEKTLSSMACPLIAPHLSNQPVSDFAARLLALVTRLQKNRCLTLKHDVKQDDARLAVPNVEVRWRTDSPEFRDCFVMKLDLALGPKSTLEMDVQVCDDHDASTNDGEVDDLKEGDEDEAVEVVEPPRKVSKRKNRW